jgi:hypothetical protein
MDEEQFLLTIFEKNSSAGFWMTFGKNESEAKKLRISEAMCTKEALLDIVHNWTQLEQSTRYLV